MTKRKIYKDICIPKDIVEINTEFVTSCPFFYEFVSNFKWIEVIEPEKGEMGNGTDVFDEDVLKKDKFTCGVTVKHNRIYFFIGRDFWKELSRDEKVGIIIHEIMHLVYSHCTRPKEKYHVLKNIADDICINETIKNYKMSGNSCKLPSSACMLEYLNKKPDSDRVVKEGEFDWGDFKDMEYTGELSSEAIYLFLLEKYSKQLQQSDKLRRDISEWLGDTNFDEHILPEDWFNDPVAKSILDNIVQNARSRGYGSESNNMKQFVEKLCKPKVDWKKVLRNFISTLSTQQNSSKYYETYSKINRRCEEIQGKKYFSQKLTVAIDVSGSCYDQTFFSYFLSEITNISKITGSVNIIQFDTEIKKVISDCSNITPSLFEFVGGGGTDLDCVFEYLSKQKDKTSLIVLTDGCFDNNINYRNTDNIAWVIINNDDFSISKGQVINVNLNEGN